MLSGISSSKYLEVTSGSATYIQKNYNTGNFMTGDMRYDLDSQTIKVFDGQTWQSLYGSIASVNLTDEAQAAIEWAKNKIAEEQRLHILARTNPALKDAIDALQRAEEQVKIVAALVDNT